MLFSSAWEYVDAMIFARKELEIAVKQKRSEMWRKRMNKLRNRSEAFHPNGDELELKRGMELPYIHCYIGNRYMTVERPESWIAAIRYAIAAYIDSWGMDRYRPLKALYEYRRTIPKVSNIYGVPFMELVARRAQLQAAALSMAVQLQLLELEWPPKAQAPEDTETK